MQGTSVLQVGFDIFVKVRNDDPEEAVRSKNATGFPQKMSDFVVSQMFKYVGGIKIANAAVLEWQSVSLNIRQVVSRLTDIECGPSPGEETIVVITNIDRRNRIGHTEEKS